MVTRRSDETGGANSVLGRAVVAHRAGQAAGEDSTAAPLASGVIGVAAERGCPQAAGASRNCFQTSSMRGAQRASTGERASASAAPVPSR